MQSLLPHRKRKPLDRYNIYIISILYYSRVSTEIVCYLDVILCLIWTVGSALALVGLGKDIVDYIKSLGGEGAQSIPPQCAKILH